MEAHNLIELELEEEGFKIKLKKPEGIQEEIFNEGEELHPEDKTSEFHHLKKEEKETVTEITSLLVGTFHSSMAPNTSHYVKIGDKIIPGQPLCVIESMGIMNEMISEKEGEILDILVEDGQAVQYRQKLFLVKNLV